MPKKRALILVKMDPPAGVDEVAWSKWYHTTHLETRLALPGFLYARRFVRIEEALKRAAAEPQTKYLALVDLTSIDVLKSDAYLQLREKEASLPANSFEAITRKAPNFARGNYEQIFPETGDYRPPNTRFLFVVGHDVPAGKHKEFNAWYNTEHIPGMLRCPGFVAARRFKLAKEFTPPGVAPVPQYISVYDLDRENPFRGDIFEQEADTPWTTWVRSWFQRRIRMLFRRIYPET
ncbi:MAG: hypothetical protein Q7R57_07720 [Dehalococcoidales bacterium]|nr:hypothetical protein [Dehalococcoidales bacterium]